MAAAPDILSMETIRADPELVKGLSKRGTAKVYNHHRSLANLSSTYDSDLGRYIYSGLVLVNRLFNDMYVVLVYVGLYTKGEKTVHVFAERETGTLFSEHPDELFFFANLFSYYVLSYPLYAEEVAENVRLCGAAHESLMGFASPNPGFTMPLFPITKPGLVTLSMQATMDVLQAGINDVYYLTSLETLLLKLRPNKPKDVYKEYDLTRDGYFAAVVPHSSVGRNASMLFQVSSIHIEYPLDAALIFCEVPLISAPPIEFIPTVPPAAASLLLTMEMGDIVAFQPSEVPNIAHVGAFYSFGTSTKGKRLVVLQINDALAMVPLKQLQQYAGENRVWTWPAPTKDGMATKFDAPAVQYPKSYAPTPVADLPAAKSFYNMIRYKDCTRDAWMQRESTCWAAAVLNIITLTPSLRQAFLSQPILTGPLNPEGETALTVQRAVACKSTDDAPYCAFSGPEMVCQLLRVRLNEGHNGPHQLIALMSAAGISVGNGTSTKDRFQLVHVSTVSELGYETQQVPAFVLDVHAVSGLVYLRDSRFGHIIAGVRCPSNSPGQPYQERYLMPDSHRVLEYNWLAQAQNASLTLESLRAAFRDKDVEYAEFWVLCDLLTEHMVTTGNCSGLSSFFFSSKVYYALGFLSSRQTQVMIVGDHRLRFFQQDMLEDADPTDFVREMFAQLATQALVATSSSTFAYRGVPCQSLDAIFADGTTCNFASQQEVSTTFTEFLVGVQTGEQLMPYFTLRCTLSEEANAVDWIMTDADAAAKYGVGAESESGCVFKDVQCGLLGEVEKGTVGKVVTYKEAVHDLINLEHLQGADPKAWYTVQGIICDAPLRAMLGACATTKFAKAPTTFMAMVKYPYAGELLTALASPQEFMVAAIYLLRGLLHLHERGVFHFDIRDSHILVKEDYRTRFIGFGGPLYYNSHYAKGLTPKGVDKDVPQNYYVDPFDVAIAHLSTCDHPKAAMPTQAYCVRKWITNHLEAASAFMYMPGLMTYSWPEMDQEAVTSVLDITANPLSTTRLHTGIDVYCAGMTLIRLAGQMAAKAVFDSFKGMYMEIVTALVPALHYDVRHRQRLPDILEGLETLAKTWGVLDLVPAPSPLR